MSHIKISLKHRAEGQKNDKTWMASRRVQLTVKREAFEGAHVFNYSYRHLKPIACQLRVNNIVSGNITNCELVADLLTPFADLLPNLSR